MARVKREKLTTNQDLFVQANCGRMTIREMAEAQKIPYSRIYAHMKANEIPIREHRTKKVRVVDVTAPGCFNSKDLKRMMI